jgi:hypothetical protein
MKVVKVIVDELPETCRDCHFMEYVSFSANFDNPVSDVFWCEAKGESICEAVEFHKDPVNKPNWCPLVALSDIDGNIVYHLQKKIYGKAA